MNARYHFPLVVAIVLSLGFAAKSTAQERQVTSSLPAIVEIAADRGDNDEITLRQFDPDAGATILLAGKDVSDGFIFGTNDFGDIGLSVAFQIPGGMESLEILQINAYMFTSGGALLSSYDAVVWDGDDQIGPQDDLGRKTFSIDDIAGQSGPDQTVSVTEHVFDDPIVVDAAFHVGFDWDLDNEPQDIGFVSSAPLAAPSPFEWVRLDDGSWITIAAIWEFTGAHVWIEVVARDAAVSSEDGAHAQEFVLSSVFPNPVATLSHIELDAASAQQISAQVFNMLGQRVATVFEGTAPAGRSLLPISSSNLAPGMYLVRVLGEDFSMARKFVVAH